MPKIFYVPIEPYEERYTGQWYRWFGAAFKELGIDYEYIDAERLTDTIVDGQVLDVYGTNFYKASQLMVLIGKLKAGKIKDGDVIFLADLWFPGVEMLAYIRNMTRVNFKIFGIFHAGTWDRNDFTFKTGMRKWGKYIEAGWIRLADKIFVATEYHKELIIEHNARINRNKIIVTNGLPFEAHEVRREVPKENIVVFPHRLDVEKRPDLFDGIVMAIKAHYPHLKWKFLKTKTCCKTKEEYYQLLGKAKIAISFAEQETFGYAMLEAVANGCVPIVPNALSYEEMDIYPEEYCYDNTSFCAGYVASDILLKCIKDFDSGKCPPIQVEKLDQYKTVKFLEKVLCHV